MSSGLARDTVVVGPALTTTALGTLVPMLQDARVMEARFGSYISAIGTVGEFGPIVAVALLLTNKEPLLTSLLLPAFIVVAVATVLLAARSQPPRLVEMLGKHMESSAQLPFGCHCCSSCCWCSWPRPSVSTCSSAPSAHGPVPA